MQLSQLFIAFNPRQTYTLLKEIYKLNRKLRFKAQQNVNE